LYSVVVGDLSAGTTTKIAVKGKDINEWLHRIDVFLNYRNRNDVDGLGIRLKTFMIALANMLPVAFGNVTSGATMDSAKHPVERLLGEASLTLWSFALNPLEEYYGTNQEVERMYEAWVDLKSRGIVGNTVATAGSTLSPVSRDNEDETTEALVLLANGDSLRSQDENSRIWRHILPSVTERSKSSFSSELRHGVSPYAAGGFLPTPMSVSWHGTRVCRAKWMAREELAGGPPLYKTIPGRFRAEGKEEIEIKGKYCAYWTEVIRQKCQGKDPAQLIPRVTALLNVLKNPRPYMRDTADWPEAPIWKVQIRRRSQFAREVALPVWIVASDFDTEYLAVAEHLRTLYQRAYSHVGLKIPDNSSSSTVDHGSKISQTITSMALTEHGESIIPTYSSNVIDSGPEDDDQTFRNSVNLRKISKSKEQRDRVRELTAKRTRRYYARLKAERQKESERRPTGNRSEGRASDM
jgi:hypothetical protein